MVFPRAGHGLVEYETRADGSRADTRYPDGCFAMQFDFADDGRLAGRYGDDAIDPPPAGHWTAARMRRHGAWISPRAGSA